MYPNEQEFSEQNKRHPGRNRLPTRHREPGYRPEYMKSRERMRHDHVQNLSHRSHDREESYRTRMQDEQFLNELNEGQVESEYPRSGKNYDHKIARHQDYTGVGPIGYKRSDSRVEDEICDLLAHDQYIDASNIVVSVKNGIVNLAGSVRQREDRVEAEMLAESVIGVEDIQNDIRVIKLNMTPSVFGRSH